MNATKGALNAATIIGAWEIGRAFFNLNHFPTDPLILVFTMLAVIGMAALIDLGLHAFRGGRPL